MPELSEFGKKLRDTRKLISFRPRLTQMTREDHESGLYRLIDAVELKHPRFKPEQTLQKTDKEIREMPELDCKLTIHAPRTQGNIAEKWDFIYGKDRLILCDDEGFFNVNYYTSLVEGTPGEQTKIRDQPQGPMMYGREHPNIKRGPGPHGPEKKY